MSLSLGIGGHQSPVFKNDEWLTPPHILAGLGVFDLDPCASIVQPWQTATNVYTVRDNGLTKPWFGRVWLNPPYGGPSIIGPWMRRMVAHGCGIALIFARTETALFFETTWRAASSILFLKGRLFFHRTNGTRAKSNSGAPSVLVSYGPRDAEVLRDCGIAGYWVDLRKLPEPPQ